MEAVSTSSGAGGGPAMFLPEASNFPWWQGQRKQFSPPFQFTAQEACVQRADKITGRPLSMRKKMPGAVSSCPSYRAATKVFDFASSGFAKRTLLGFLLPGPRPMAAKNWRHGTIVTAAITPIETLMTVVRKPRRG